MLHESNEANDAEAFKRERDAEYKKVHRDKRAQERKLLLLKVCLSQSLKCGCNFLAVMFTKTTRKTSFFERGFGSLPRKKTVNQENYRQKPKFLQHF